MKAVIGGMLIGGVVTSLSNASPLIMLAQVIAACVGVSIIAFDAAQIINRKK